MADKSRIEWTEATWNPIRGCSVVSPGCKNCYAMKQAHRFSGPGGAYEGLTRLTSNGPVWTGKVQFVNDVLLEPLGWRKPRRVFVNSMSDLFHESLSFEQIDKIMAVIAMSGEHTFQVLTKRPAKMLKYFSRFGDSIEGWVQAFENGRDANGEFLWSEEGDCRISNALYGHLGEGFNVGWPMRNLWLGVSCENQKAKERIDILRNTPAAVRMLSLEPLLEDLGEIDLRGIHWVIVGGESGPNARPMHPSWARSLRDQCKAAGVPFFFKQWGAYKPFERRPDDDETEAFQITPQGVMLQADVRGEFPPIPEGTVEMVRVGKKEAGRTLDGRQWSEYPEAAR